MKWRWIDKHTLVLLHDESLAEHGGAAGIRDEGLLDSALARPLNLVTRTEPVGLVKTFIEFARSGEVHGLIEAQFFVPIAE